MALHPVDPPPLEERKPGESFQPAFEEFLRIADAFVEVLGRNEPENWGLASGLFIRRLEERLHGGEFCPEVESYLGEWLLPIMQKLYEARYPWGSVGRRQRLEEHHPLDSARRVIHDVGQLFEDQGAAPEECESVRVNRISFKDLLAMWPESFRIEEKEGQQIFHMLFEGETYSFVIPSNSKVAYKSPWGRILLKVIAGASPELIRAELPIRDTDIIGSGSAVVLAEEARVLGADPDGIELVEGLETDEDLSYVFQTRDLNISAVFVTRNGLVFADEAYQAARTGHIALWAHDRGLYGREYLFFGGQKLANGRGMQRLLNLLVQRKAESCDFTPLNREIDMGIYWLVVARKFLRQGEVAAERLRLLYYLGKQMGQVREGENDIFDVLARVHSQYPFFDMGEDALDERGVALWLANKLRKLLIRSFRSYHRIPGSLRLLRHKGDTTPYRVTTKGFQSSSSEDARIAAQISPFLVSCALRTNEYRGR